MSVPNIGTAIIGCGEGSDIYFENFRNRFRVTRLVACADSDRRKSDMYAEKYGIASLGIDELLDSLDIALVINLTGPEEHYGISKAAIEHSKYVFSEKMLAMTLEEGFSLVDDARNHCVRFCAAPDIFLGAGVQTARYVLDHGLIGRPLSAEASISRESGRSGDFIPGPGGECSPFPFYGRACCLTALSVLLGPVAEVSAFGQEPCSAMSASLRFRSGVPATLHLDSGTVSGADSGIAVFGTEGIMYMGDPERFGAPVFIRRAGSGKVPFPFTHGYSDNAAGLGAAEMAWTSFRGIEGHRSSPELAYHVLEVMRCMEKSAASGTVCTVGSAFAVPAPLPSGFICSGASSPSEENALV